MEHTDPKEPPRIAMSDRMIVEQFKRNCPGWTADQVIERFRLGRLEHELAVLDAFPDGRENARVKCMVLAAPGDARPMGAEDAGLIRGVAQWEGLNAEESEHLVSQWKTIVERLGVGTWHTRPPSMTPALPMRDVDFEVQEGLEIMKELDQRGWPMEKSVIRVGRLSFYKHFRLLEVVDHAAGSRGYALYRKSDGGLDLRPLDGRSAVLHDANGVPGELDLGDLEKQTDYLRFFCWAVDGGESAFLLPSSPWELPLQLDADHKAIEQVVPEGWRKEMQAVAGIRAVQDAEAATHKYARDGEGHDRGRLAAHVAYGTALFKGWFKLEKNGEVSMVDDQPLVANLPMRIERFGHGRVTIIGPRLPKEVLDPYGADRDAFKTAAPATNSGPALIAELADPERGPLVVREPVRIDLATMSEWSSRELPISNVRFEKTVRLCSLATGCRLKFINCVFEQGIDARLATLDGEVHLERCDLGHISTERSAALDCTEAEVTHSLVCVDCHLGGGLAGHNLMVGSDLRVRGCHVGGELRNGGSDDRRMRHWNARDQARNRDRAASTQASSAEVVLSGAEVGGSLELCFHGGGQADIALVCLGGLVAEGCVVRGDLSLEGSVWLGGLALNGCRIDGDLVMSQAWGGRGDWRSGLVGKEHLALCNAEVNGNVIIGSCDIGANIDLNGLRAQGVMDLCGTRCDNDLILSFARIKGWMRSFRYHGDELGGRSPLSIGGELVLSAAHIGYVELRGLTVKRNVTVRTGQFGRFILGPSPMPRKDKVLGIERGSVGGLLMRGVMVDEVVDLTAIRVKSSREGVVNEQNRRDEEGQMAISYCRIGADLLLFQPDLAQVILRRWDPDSPSGAWIWDERVVDGTTQKLQPGILRMEIESDLDLQASNVGGKLDLRNATVGGSIWMNDMSVTLDVHMGHEGSPPYGHPTLWAEGLRTTCRMIDLEKIECRGDVFMTGLEATGPAKDGSIVKAREAMVRGELLLMEKQTGDSVAKALIHGRVDLAAARINHLIIGRDNFPRHDQPDRCGVNLERATIHRLEVRKPVPGPLDLRGVAVHQWEVEEGSADQIAVLENMHPFDRSVWIGVERNLRNEGRDAEANRMYRAMLRAGKSTSIGRRFHTREELLGGLGVMALLVLLLAINFSLGSWPVLIALGLFILGSFMIRALGKGTQKRWRKRIESLGKRIVGAKGVRWAGIGWHGFVGLPTDHGTRIWRPMVLWVILLFPSFWIFNDPRNVELELGARVVRVADGRVVGSADPFMHMDLSEDLADDRFRLVELGRDEVAPLRGQDWSPADAAFLVLRYQVPILDLAFHTPWTAGQDPITLAGVGSFTPEQWALFVKVYSFIAWSLLLIGLSVRVFRGKQG